MGPQSWLCARYASVTLCLSAGVGVGALPPGGALGALQQADCTVGWGPLSAAALLTMPSCH